jgi:glutamate formiminotransferase
MATPDGKPDFGPARPHPTAGATAVGARPFLVAFNVQLATTDADVARRMAVAMRERDGGLAAVQALGIPLQSMGCVQLSMNLIDHHRTPLWRVWDEALRLSAREGVDVIDSELVGLAPAAALLAVADRIGSDPSGALEQRLRDAGNWLRIRGFDPGMALDVRLARIRGADARGGGSG